MKTKNVIIGVLIIAVITLSVLLFYSRTSLNKTNRLNRSQTAYHCTEILNANDGEIIEIEEAVSAIKKFDDLYPGDEIKALHIGLSTLQNLMDSIDLYNKQPDVKDSISGLRLYRGITSRKHSGPNNTSYQINEKYDLVVVPTLASGIDLHRVYFPPLVEIKVPIYSHFRPCPKLCGGADSTYILP